MKRDVEMIIMDVMLSSPRGQKKSPAEKFLTRQAVLKNKPVRGRRHPGRGSRRTVSAGPCRSSRGWGIPTTDVSEPSIASRCWNAQSLDLSARQNGWARVGEGSGAVSAGPAQWVGWFPSGDHRQAWIDVEERSSGSARSVRASSLWCSRTVVFPYCGVPVLWCSGTTHRVTRARPARR